MKSILLVISTGTLIIGFQTQNEVLFNWASIAIAVLVFKSFETDANYHKLAKHKDDDQQQSKQDYSSSHNDYNHEF